MRRGDEQGVERLVRGLDPLLGHGALGCREKRRVAGRSRTGPDIGHEVTQGPELGAAVERLQRAARKLPGVEPVYGGCGTRVEIAGLCGIGRAAATEAMEFAEVEGCPGVTAIGADQVPLAGLGEVDGNAAAKHIHPTDVVGRFGMPEIGSLLEELQRLGRIRFNPDAVEIGETHVVDPVHVAAFGRLLPIAAGHCRVGRASLAALVHAAERVHRKRMTHPGGGFEERPGLVEVLRNAPTLVVDEAQRVHRVDIAGGSRLLEHGLALDEIRRLGVFVVVPDGPEGPDMPERGRLAVGGQGIVVAAQGGIDPTELIGEPAELGPGFHGRFTGRQRRHRVDLPGQHALADTLGVETVASETVAVRHLDVDADPHLGCRMLDRPEDGVDVLARRSGRRNEGQPAHVRGIERAALFDDAVAEHHLAEGQVGRELDLLAARYRLGLGRSLEDQIGAKPDQRHGSLDLVRLRRRHDFRRRRGRRDGIGQSELPVDRDGPEIGVAPRVVDLVGERVDGAGAGG